MYEHLSVVGYLKPGAHYTVCSCTMFSIEKQMCGSTDGREASSNAAADLQGEIVQGYLGIINIISIRGHFWAP